jgi:hypothetical protein
VAEGSHRLETQRFLDHQASLRRGVIPGPRANPRDFRDYPNLSWLAGLSAAEYRTLGPRDQRHARLTIDRQLSTHVQYGAPRMPFAKDSARRVGGPPGRAGTGEPAGRAPRATTRERHARQFLRYVRDSPRGRKPPAA